MEVREMTRVAADRPQSRAARIAGFTFLFAMAIVVVANYGISFRLSIPNDAAETARNLIAHEQLYRVNIACDLLYCVTILVLLTALYVVLKPVNRGLALFAAFCRLVLALMWAVIALNMLGALRLLSGLSYLNVFEADRLQALARLHLDTSYHAYYIGLPFWALASTLCAYLWFKSGYVPKTLALYGVISSVWCAFCAFAFLISPDFQNTVHPGWFDMPMVIFEMVLGVWLLVRGLRPRGAMQPDQGKAGAA
jgi:hypothetical protein